jgi:multimeric flavodoxin WrbA
MCIFCLLEPMNHLFRDFIRMIYAFACYIIGMYVVAFNGSPKKDGNTNRLIRYALAEIESAGIKTNLIHICGKPVHGCFGCMKCAENQDRACAITTDIVNFCIEEMIKADGIIIGSPTYFSDMTAETKALIDRSGFVTKVNGNLLSRKAGAAISVARRAGAVCTVDAIQHLFTISDMITIGSTYWNMAIGLAPGDVDSDEEGIETMKRLGQNMAWFLQIKEKAGM